MKKIKVLVDFIQFSVAVKVAFYRNVIAKLTDNPDYPSPDVPLVEAKAAVDNFEAAIVAAKDGSHTAVSAMHGVETRTDGVFTILAHYVDRVAAGDETKISTCTISLSSLLCHPRKRKRTMLYPLNCCVVNRDSV